VAPLPPVAADDMAGIGRTNDAVLYGGEVTLWVRGDDASLEAIGPRVPSSASPDYGEPFANIFARYGHDFYKIDPHLFSAAVVTIMNLDTGRTLRFGRSLPEVISRSFLG
jgi:methenyltetrahydromethanopterin cyclohydrolase